jgi:hypothetical protein
MAPSASPGDDEVVVPECHDPQSPHDRKTGTVSLRRHPSPASPRISSSGYVPIHAIVLHSNIDAVVDDSDPAGDTAHPKAYELLANDHDAGSEEPDKGVGTPHHNQNVVSHDESLEDQSPDSTQTKERRLSLRKHTKDNGLKPMVSTARRRAKKYNRFRLDNSSSIAKLKFTSNTAVKSSRKPDLPLMDTSSRNNRLPCIEDFIPPKLPKKGLEVKLFPARLGDPMVFEFKVPENSVSYR